MNTYIFDNNQDKTNEKNSNDFLWEKILFILKK